MAHSRESSNVPRRVSSAESDESLVAQAQRGSKDAFGALVRRYEARIYAFARRFARSHHDAQDITQEAFISAYAAIDTFRGESSLKTWLYRIARNAALTRQRSDARRGPGQATHEPADVEPAWDADADRELDLRRFVELALVALARLEDAQRTAFLLCDLEEVPAADVARTFCTSPVAVRQRAYRARRALRRLLACSSM